MATASLSSQNASDVSQIYPPALQLVGATSNFATQGVHGVPEQLADIVGHGYDDGYPRVAYLSAHLDGFDSGLQAREMQESRPPVADLVTAEAAYAVDPARVPADRQLLGDEVAGSDAFIARTRELVDVIRRHGPEAGAADAPGGAR